MGIDERGGSASDEVEGLMSLIYFIILYVQNKGRVVYGDIAPFAGGPSGDGRVHILW